MPVQEQERIREEVRAIIKKECGVKDYLRGVEKPVPSPEEVMAKTGMSEDELTRRFMEHLIQQARIRSMRCLSKRSGTLKGSSRTSPNWRGGNSERADRWGVTSMCVNKQVPRTWENPTSMV